MEDTILSILASCLVVALAIYLLAVRRSMDSISVKCRRVVVRMQAEVMFFSGLMLAILAYFSFRGITTEYYVGLYACVLLLAFHLGQYRGLAESE